ncbi:hypothetical protein [Nocardia terpenica]|nr:hypothetical protein [Nocardia terpenica]
MGAEHSGIVDGLAGRLVQVTSPDGLEIRLYTIPGPHARQEEPI